MRHFARARKRKAARTAQSDQDCCRGDILQTRSWNGSERVALPEFLYALHAERIPFRDERQRAALAAFLRFGRGRHPAQLNFGDCMSYAVARVSGLPLVYTGDGFGRTDLNPLHRPDVSD